MPLHPLPPKRFVTFPLPLGKTLSLTIVTLSICRACIACILYEHSSHTAHASEHVPSFQRGSCIKKLLTQDDMMCSMRPCTMVLRHHRTHAAPPVIYTPARWRRKETDPQQALL